jgi:hypothetical protein
MTVGIFENSPAIYGRAIFKANSSARSVRDHGRLKFQRIKRGFQACFKFGHSANHCNVDFRPLVSRSPIPATRNDKCNSAGTSIIKALPRKFIAEKLFNSFTLRINLIKNTFVFSFITAVYVKFNFPILLNGRVNEPESTNSGTGPYPVV